MTTLDDTGVALGSPEDARGWIGRRGASHVAPAPVSDLGIRNFCALIEDGNPSYWVEGISPPGLLLGYAFSLPWRPDGPAGRALLGLEVPLPGPFLINVASDTRFVRDLVVGDIVSMVEEILDISDEKQTKLGRGHFVTTRMTFTNQHDEVVATNDNVMVRYTSGERSAVAGAGGAAAAPPVDGERIPEIRLHVDHRRVCHNAAATWDWFPGHHDPAYARAQGQPTIYVSTIFFQGLLDRMVMEWAGPGAVIERRRLRIRNSLYAGQDAVAGGWVTERTMTGTAEIVEIDAQISGPDGPCVDADITVCRPVSAAARRNAA